MKCSFERSKDSQCKRDNRQRSFGASFEKGDHHTRNNLVPALVVKPETRTFEPVLGPKKICRDCQQSHCSDELPSYRTVTQRTEKLKNCCYKCFKKGRQIDECRCKRKYVYYGDLTWNSHDRSLCMKKVSSKTDNVSIGH